MSNGHEVAALRYEGPTPHGLWLYVPATPGAGSIAYVEVAPLHQRAFSIVVRERGTINAVARFSYRARTSPDGDRLPAATVTRLVREHLARGGDER